MNRKFTQNDLIRYYYNETDEAETKAIREALMENSHLRQQYDNFYRTFEVLDKAFMEPDETSVDIIREHSAHFSSLETS